MLHRGWFNLISEWSSDVLDGSHVKSDGPSFSVVPGADFDGSLRGRANRRYAGPSGRAQGLINTLFLFHNDRGNLLTVKKHRTFKNVESTYIIQSWFT